MNLEHSRPADIERTSMRIIGEELLLLGKVLPPENEAVIKRVIHATADFDYAGNLFFSEDAVRACVEKLHSGIDIITDSNMALAGVSKAAAKAVGCDTFCYMAHPDIVKKAKEDNTTRATAAMRYAMEAHPGAAFAVGNAPTALFVLAEKIAEGILPAFVVATPVGFVNVVEAKEQIVSVCVSTGVPVIAAMGRKGGSTVAAAITNALLYTAAEMLDPKARGWN